MKLFNLIDQILICFQVANQAFKAILYIKRIIYILRDWRVRWCIPAIVELTAVLELLGTVEPRETCDPGEIDPFTPESKKV